MSAAENREKTYAERGACGSTVWPVVNGVQVVEGPDYARNSRRDKRATALIVRSFAEGQRTYDRLKAEAEDAGPLRQLSLWEVA